MFISQVMIYPKTKSTVLYNKISGHSWTETNIISGYEVTGGGFLRSSHSTLKSAEADKAIRESINRKFPR